MRFSYLIFTFGQGPLAWFPIHLTYLHFCCYFNPLIDSIGHSFLGNANLSECLFQNIRMSWTPFSDGFMVYFLLTNKSIFYNHQGSYHSGLFWIYIFFHDIPFLEYFILKIFFASINMLPFFSGTFLFEYILHVWLPGGLFCFDFYFQTLSKIKIYLNFRVFRYNRKTYSGVPPFVAEGGFQARFIYLNLFQSIWPA